MTAVGLCVPFFAMDTEDTAGGPPQFAFAEQVFSNNAASLAPVLGVTPDAIIARLDGAGFDMSAPDLPLREIADKSGKNSFQLSDLLTFSES